MADCYGRFPSLLEKGLASDRWVVNWRIATARVEKRLRGEQPPFDPMLPRVNETRLNTQGFPQNCTIRLDLGHRRLLVETPAQTDTMPSKPCPWHAAGGLKHAASFSTTFPKGTRWRIFSRPKQPPAGVASICCAGVSRA